MARSKLIALVVAGLLAAAYFGLQRLIPDPLPEFELSGQTMGTRYNVVVVDPDEAQLVELGERIQQTLDDIEARFSTWDENSELSRFNQAAADTWIQVSDELCPVLHRALTISRLSDGAYDPTIGYLVALWGFSSHEFPEKLPDQAAIDTALSRTGYRRLQLDCEENRARKNGDVSVDLSGYVKGFAVDEVAAMLVTAGISSFLVEIGGEVFAHRLSGSGSPWQIAVEMPESPATRPYSVIRPYSMGVATSGDYRNFFEIDGVRYSHVIDPATGYPLSHNTASVTVVADTTAEADIWATALLVMGSERGEPYASGNNIAALFIDRNGDDITARSSKSFEQYRRD